MGIDVDPEPDPLETNEEEEETPFDGEDFKGDADAELAPSEYDDKGMGAVVAGLHVVCESSNEGEDESLAHLAALAITGEAESNEKLANDLISSIKDRYEARGSGLKPSFHGPSAKQLKASEQQVWV